MDQVKAKHAALLKVVIAHAGPNETPGVEVVCVDGEHFVLTMSGEGMKGLIGDMTRFLDQHPQLANTKSQQRQ